MFKHYLYLFQIFLDQSKMYYFWSIIVHMIEGEHYFQSYEALLFVDFLEFHKRFQHTTMYATQGWHAQIKK